MDDTKPTEIWVTFAGIIEISIVRGAFALFGNAIADGIRTIHLLVHSPGGNVSDGVVLHSYLKSLPIDVIGYNSGIVASAATTVFLGAKRRIVSPYGIFLVHKTVVPAGHIANAQRLQSAVDGIILDDIRTESILREQVTLTPEQWDIHRIADLTLSASEAIECGLAHEIGYFTPSGRLFNF